ncbi:MAG: putative Na+/H+ antiporter [Candidatus Neomarinimicrobiota bacterium]
MKSKVLVLVAVLVFLLPAVSVCSDAVAGSEHSDAVAGGDAHEFPPSLASYDDAHLESIPQILKHRIRTEPFNLVATLIFLGAIIHAFLASKLTTISHRRRRRHAEKIGRGEADERSVDLAAELLHFLGEVEVVFGIWLVPLVVAIVSFHGWSSTVHYIHDGVNLTEAAFVVVIMVLASTRPILRLAEAMMSGVAKLFGGSLSALWLTIMTLGPLLGSFITEPAAMTICAMLLSHKFYDLGPSARFKYATLALLFVNVSVGGVLTNFAAPPVLMVAGPWQWSTGFMVSHFGWKVIIGILVSNSLYFWMFRKELATMQQAFKIRDLKDQIERKYLTQKATEAAWAEAAQQGEERERLIDTMRSTSEQFIETISQRMKSADLSELEELGYDKEVIRKAADKRFEEARLYRVRRFLPLLLPEKDRAEFLDPDWDKRDDPVPAWITLVHVLFMAWTIINAHYPELFIIVFLFFLGFSQVTTQYQNRIFLRPALLVGFFLAGLVIHGGLQAWWIAPVLGNLSEGMLMVSATVLTAFNDNAAITYLSTLVPGFTDGLKYAVVAGAIAGGGLTVIANAPNPAGQALLKKHFDGAVAPQRLLFGALVPTVIVWLCLALL